MNTNYLFLFSLYCRGILYVENVMKIKKRNPEPFGTGLFYGRGGTNQPNILTIYLKY